MTQDGSQPTVAAASGKRVNTQLIDAVEVALEAVLGKAEITVAELTALEKGAVLPLDAELSSAIELRLNGVAIARGELVAVDDKFAVKLTEIAA